MGFPVMITVLKEDCNDVETVQGALETLLGALTPLSYAKAPKNDVQPATMNAYLLSREADSISLLLGLLVRILCLLRYNTTSQNLHASLHLRNLLVCLGSQKVINFYTRYYTLQLLTALLNNSPSRKRRLINDSSKKQWKVSAKIKRKCHEASLGTEEPIWRREWKRGRRSTEKKNVRDGAVVSTDARLLLGVGSIDFDCRKMGGQDGKVVDRKNEEVSSGLTVKSTITSLLMYKHLL